MVSNKRNAVCRDVTVPYVYQWMLTTRADLCQFSNLVEGFDSRDRNTIDLILSISD